MRGMMKPRIIRIREPFSLLLPGRTVNAATLSLPGSVGGRHRRLILVPSAKRCIMPMKLYTYPNGKNAAKSLVAAQLVGVKIELPPFQMGVTNKTPEFLAKKNPHGKVPVLELDDGRCIFESNAIARYVARLGGDSAKLFGTSTWDLGQVEMWIDVSTNEIDAPLNSWVLPIIGVWPKDAAKEKAAQEAVRKGLAVLEKHLMTHTYLVGDTVTLADIVCVCNLFPGFTVPGVFDANFRKGFPNTTRYFTTVVNQPAFKKVLGEAKLC
ncbi:elongation factor 1-gamma [Pycnococcus provasolii]